MRQKIGEMILSKTLEMPLTKYLVYIEKTTKANHNHGKKRSLYARVMIKDAAPCFEVSDKHLESIYPTENYTDNKTICSLKWINTLNRFSLHILKSLLDYQSKYWFSCRETDLRPLTYKQFLSLYALQYLDKSRLSRLIFNLSVTNPQGKVISLRSLFISQRRYHGYLVKEMVENNENALRDKEIQCLLAQKGVYLSIRTICNCRMLLNIPNYREKSVYYYGKDITFSDHMPLSRKHLKKIPTGVGVYELSISPRIDYPNQKSNVVYIGSSKNLRKRIANYLGTKLKNNRLNKFINNYSVSVRFYLTENHILTENFF
ncbi:hypothetical protein ACFL23_02090 [Patescibacteria group bacterium]